MILKLSIKMSYPNKLHIIIIITKSQRRVTFFLFCFENFDVTTFK